jgi:hypothetical protein
MNTRMTQIVPPISSKCSPEHDPSCRQSELESGLVKPTDPPTYSFLISAEIYISHFRILSILEFCDRKDTERDSESQFAMTVHEKMSEITASLSMNHDQE